MVEVYHKHERLAVHQRNRKRYGYTTLAGHMPSHHRFVSEWSSERFIAWAGNIGESCQGYIMAILDKKQHPEQSYKSCLGVLHLAKKYGRGRLDNACRRATEYGAYNYNMVERILKKGWDKLDEDTDENLEMPEHQNIRGGKYYE
jgi:transposase